MGALRRYGQFNQAGDLSPRTGYYSNTLEARLGALTVNPNVQVVSANANSGVLPYRHPFQNYIGVTVIRNVKDVAIVNTKGYGGVAPADIQPTIQRPKPWLTDTL